MLTMALMSRPAATRLDLSPARLRALLGGFLEPLFGYAAMRSRDREVAKDAVQESLIAALDALRGGRRWRDEEALWAWLVAVARNKVADEYRRDRKRFPSVSTLGVDIERLVESVADGTAIPDDLASREEVEQLCRLALSELAPRHREALERFYRDGLSQRAIARAMGVSTKAVESILARARRELQKVLRRNLDNPEGLL